MLRNNADAVRATCKLTVDFRYTLPRILQRRLEHFCELTVDFRYKNTVAVHKRIPKKTE